MFFGSRAKQKFRILSACVCLSCLLSISLRADNLHLKDGRVIEAEDIWEVGETVWYRKGKVINSVPKTEIVRVTKPEPVSVEATPSAKASVSEEKKAAAGPGSPETRKVTRILLKGGAAIDADSVWEAGESVGYRLGKMQAFIERTEIERIERNLSVAEDKPVETGNLRYSTGRPGLDQLILFNADRYGVDPTLIFLVMREESRFNHRAVSRVGARGLMQLMPQTARRLGVRNIHDPVENVAAGTRYLRGLLEMFNGDMNLALAGYNAGEHAVMRYGRRVPPYRETLNYVWRINTAYRHSLAPTQASAHASTNGSRGRRK